jgi:hypothetical protein
MKYIVLLAAILLATNSTNVSAQGDNETAMSLAHVKGVNSSENKLKSTECKATRVSIRAMRDFCKSHKDVTDARWFKTQRGEIATFRTNNSHTKIVYDKKGNRLYTMISYHESKLDHHVRHLVKSNYYDADIIGVHEFQFEKKTIYVIKLQDQQSDFLTLKVCDGQAEEISSRSGR